MPRYRKKEYDNGFDFDVLYDALPLLIIIALSFSINIYKNDKVLFYVFITGIILSIIALKTIKNRKVNGIRYRSLEVLDKNEEKGKMNELEIYEKMSELDFCGKVIRDIYIPSENGKMSQIDLVLITNRGLFAIESKNYDGIVVCNNGRYWKYIKNKNYKISIYSPLFQNNKHVACLCTYLNISIANIESVICFGMKSYLKNVEKLNGIANICNTDHVELLIRDLYDKKQDFYSNEEIDVMYEKLKKCKDHENILKSKHLENIKDNYESQSGE